MKIIYTLSIVLISTFFTKASNNFNNASTIVINSLQPAIYNSNNPTLFKFVATQAQMQIDVQSTTNLDAVVEVFDLSKRKPTLIQTQDNTYTGDIETITLNNLIIGQEYGVTVENYTTTNTGNFTINVSNVTYIAPPINDEPSGAIELTTVSSLGILSNNNLNYTYFTTFGSTFDATLPVPANCADANSSANDVWFKVKVPANGIFTVAPSYGKSTFVDASMALYSGTPGALNFISAVDDVDDLLLPSLTTSLLIPNTYVYIRYWNNAQARGNGGISIFAGANDGSSCSDALEVCDFNGVNGTYIGSTISTTRPCNMAGNSEAPNGPFGACPNASNAWNTSCSGASPLKDVTIDNNLWIKFTASLASITLNLTTSNCSRTNKPGVQMQIFSASGSCCGFEAVSDFIEPAANSGGSISATGLTPGQSYYLMIDPWGNNKCDFVVTGSSGVSFGDVFADKLNVCAGQPVTITGPTGATGYTWTASPGPNPSGTTNVITVSPTVTTTYSLDMTGFCASANTTKTVTITVGNLSPVISPATLTACKGGTTTYSVPSLAGSTYVWVVAGGTFTGQGTNTIIVTWGVGATGSVSITQTSSAGCSGTNAVNGISLVSAPKADFSYPNSPVCDNVLLLSYTLGAGATAGNFTVSPLGAAHLNGNVLPSVSPFSGTYTMTNTIVASGGCPGDVKTATFTINPSPTPTITSTNTSVCAGATGTYTVPATTNTIVWTVTGGVIASGQGTGTLTVTWGSGASGTVTIKQTSPQGCIGSNVMNVTINALPTAFIPTISPNDTICSGNTITISAAPQVNVVSTVYPTATGGVALGTINYTSLLLTTGTTATTVTYYIETKSTAGCVSKTTRDSVKVVVNPLPLAPILSYMPNDSICFGLVDTLNVVAVPGVITEVFGSATGGLPKDTLNWITPPIVANTTYYFETKIIATGCKSNTRRDSVNIAVLPLPPHPTIKGSPIDSICLKDSIWLKAFVTGTGNTVKWYTTNTGGVTIGKDSLKVSPPITTTYYVEVKNKYGCKAAETRDTMKIWVLPLPDLPKLTAALQEICEGDSIVLKATVKPTTATIFWLNGTQWKDTIQRGPDFTSPVLTSSTTYYMGSISKDGCKNDGAFEVLPVVVKPLPHVTISSNLPDNIVYVDQAIKFTANPGIYDIYKWYVDANEVFVGGPEFETQDLKEAETIKVLVIQKGCPNWGENNIKVKVLPISNAFTPNNDGKNDLFLKGLDLQIFNRWGQLLYKGNEGWDGKYKGNTVAAGTYYFSIRIKKLNSEEVVEKSGSVTVVQD
jgi:gliding motility-associated-like protein